MTWRSKNVGVVFACLALVGIAGAAPPVASKGRSLIGRSGHVATRKAPARPASSLIQTRAETIPITPFTTNPQPIPDNPGLLARTGTALQVMPMPHLGGTSLLDRTTALKTQGLPSGNSLLTRTTTLNIVKPGTGSSLLDRTTTLVQQRAGIAPGSSLLDQRGVSDKAEVLISNPPTPVAGLSTPQFGRALLRNSVDNVP